MAEPKRLQLDAPKALQRQKKLKEVPPTYRFELKLAEKDTEFAEYSYAELVKEARTEEQDLKHPASDDPFLLDEDVGKMQEIARQFEEKYNPKPGRKKKKKLGICEDFIDKGMGYDETDPFIDNEEAYDELVPSTLTTEFGGFYINKGDLEFKNLSESESCNFDGKTKKKRIRQGTEKEKRKRRIALEENQKRCGRKPLNDTQSALKPKKKSQPTVADMLQQHKANLQRMQQEGIQQMQLEPIKIDRDFESEENEESITHSDEAPNPSTISDAIESVIKAANDDVGSNGSGGIVTGSSDGEEPKVPMENIESIEAPKLPENLSPELDDVVAKLKVAAYKSEEGKCKFFSDEVNRMLLCVELKAQELSSVQRNIIYAHLASHLPCTKETLQKRAKKLRLDQEDGKLREPMQRLKDGIAAVMPQMMDKYAALVQACDARDEEKKNGVTTGSDGEDSQENGEKKISRLPKKRFEWNDAIRKYLCDVVRIKLKCYEVSKTRIQSAEEYLKHFLEAEVKNLWPPGWMQSRILFRESRAAHFYITNRPKKQILVPKKTNPVSVLNVKPGMSILNNTIIPQESEFDQIFQDNKSVPLIPPVENVLEKTENMDLLMPNHVLSVEERAAEYAKLFTLPIKTSVTDDATSIKNSENVNIQPPNKLNSSLSPPKTSSPLVNLMSDSLSTKSVISKSDKHSKSNQQSKLSYNSKVSDLHTFAEGSLASDMLARIICASLADFPYAGSHNIENASSKAASVISPNPSLLKESHGLNSKFSNDILTSPKKTDTKSFSAESRKTSQESGLHTFASLGINLESFLNPKTQSVARSSDSIIKNKGLPAESSNIVNLKLKDSIIPPHSRQFAEAFERTADTPPVSKKHSIKGLNIHSQVSPASSTSTASRLISEHINEYPSSTSPRSVESAQKMTFDLAKYSSAISTQGSISAPYKKRTKYSQSNKVNEQWNQHFLEASLGTSLLEGMKGFPFPIGSLPTPPPAHSSSPHRTPAHSQHNSPRTISHISPGLRSLHEPKSDSPNHNSQAHSIAISTSDVQRRQTLIQGPWKSTSSQSPSTSLSHFLASTSPPISNQCKTTSSNHHSSNTAVNMTPVPAHSMSQIDKVTSSFNHSPLPLRASPSHMPLSQTTKPSSNTYSPHLGQTSYTTHQSSHTVSSTHQVLVRNNVFDPSNPISTSSSPTGTFTINQEVKAANPRN